MLAAHINDDESAAGHMHKALERQPDENGIIKLRPVQGRQYQQEKEHHDGDIPENLVIPDADVIHSKSQHSQCIDERQEFFTLA